MLPAVYRNWRRLFQSTRPMRGATGFSSILEKTPSNFNPRAPCGARLRHHKLGSNCYPISIHAPHAGRDAQLLIHIGGFLEISIHAPHAGRDLVTKVMSFPIMRFQSTRPMRGATWSGLPSEPEHQHFNPRAPCGARQHPNQG